VRLDRWLLLVALLACWSKRRCRTDSGPRLCGKNAAATHCRPHHRSSTPSQTAPALDVAGNSIGGIALAVVFVTFVPLAFSGDFLDAAYEAADEEQPEWLLSVVDALLLAVVLVFGRSVRRKTGFGEVGVRTWQWWLWGAVLTLGLDLELDRPLGIPTFGRSLLYVISLGMLVAYTLKVDPVRVLRPWGRTGADEEARRRFRPALPLLVGTLAAYAGSQIWIEQLEPGTNWSDCSARDPPAGAVDKEYFAQLSQVIPLLLVALGIEAGFFRELLRDPVLRAMTIVTVLILVVGEAFAISALPESNKGCGNVLYPLHEYSAFVFTLEASFVALSTLVLALVITSAKDDRPRSNRPDCGSFGS
jgi:hypothetical protein